jgi:quinol-cytochrome oxidoreductase complex cytochrome b subunit
MLHFPSTILVFALSQGAFDLGRSPSPYVVFLQWTFLGTLVGVILHLKHRSKASPSENDSDQGQRRTSVPKTSFGILRVICVIVGLLFLLALLFWGWVLSTPHR